MGLGSSPFARHYSGNRYFFLFLRVLRCFSSPRLLHPKMVTGRQPAGLPHSDTHGSIRVCQSPCLFAAYRVLLRLRKPRHPPFALLSFFLCESRLYLIPLPGNQPSRFARLENRLFACFCLYETVVRKYSYSYSYSLFRLLVCFFSSLISRISLFQYCQ